MMYDELAASVVEEIALDGDQGKPYKSWDFEIAVYRFIIKTRFLIEYSSVFVGIRLSFVILTFLVG